MDDLFQHLGQAEQTWGHDLFTDREDIDVCEVRKDTQRNAQMTSFEFVPRKKVSDWLDRPPPICRMVLVDRNAAELRNDISVTSLYQVLKAFGLDSAYSYYSTVFAGAAALPPQQNSTCSIQSYSFCCHPKIILLWSRNETQNCIQGICFAGRAQLSAFQELLSVHWPFMEHDMIPAFLCSVLLSSEINSTQNAIKQEVRETEVRTGFHRWSGRREQGASGDLSALSAKMSGCASKYASVLRKVQVIQDLNEFIVEQILYLREMHPGSLPGAQGEDRNLNEAGRALEKHVTFMRRRAKMQEVDAKFFEQRISIQLNALFNLIAQNDAIHSHEFARDAKIIAAASQRDSFSMKILAVLTMCFLPGTFVATLFSMTIFDWDTASSPSSAAANSATRQQQSQSVVSSKFWVYWAVAVPLTLLTFTICAAWMLLERVRQKRRTSDAVSKLEDGLVRSEINALAMRRSATGTLSKPTIDT
ncbi:MAG: hypothetical protein M1821_006512 [Bathelium mastoideum]|nr:MAG: hypothetical protein M1821_006512 [Bathelium mastoideum]